MLCFHLSHQHCSRNHRRTRDVAMLTFQKKLVIHFIFIAFSAFREASSEKPIIIKRPTTQNVYLNESATFVCEVESTLPFVIDWKKSHGEILKNVTGSLLIFKGSLTLLRAKRSDSDIYRCIARNSAGLSASAQATLRVLDPLVAPTITEISPSTTIVEGDRITFTCKASGNPVPQINWIVSLEAAGVDNNARIEHPSPESIRLSSASPEDAGRYVCIADNDSGNDTGAVYLKVLGYPVFVVTPPSNVTVHENTTVSLSCKVIGSPTPDVMWYYENAPAERIRNVRVLHNKTLQVPDVKFNNRGTYTCKANNSAGLQRSKSTLLRVLRAPRLDCCPDKLTVWQNRTATEGRPFSLHCLSSGYPEPEYEWTFNNKTIWAISVLTISNVSSSNEGFYLCKARNNLGQVSLIIYAKVIVPPKVSVEPPEATVVEGGRVRFSCSATGTPLPTVTWYSSKGRELSNNTLIITNISRNDHGEYFCEATNEAGKKTAKTRLIVAVRPSFQITPRNISVNETSSVDIQCSANGPDRPVISWYRMTMDGQKMNVSESGDRLAIAKVNRSDAGFYICEARNFAGYINATFFINVQYPPYTLSSEQRVEIIAGKRATLDCPIKANPPAEIQWISPVSFHGPHLTINKAEITHSGKYSCRGKNVLGRSELTSIQVQVLSQPRIVALRMAELSNNYVSLTCVTSGTPNSSVDWTDKTPLPLHSFSVHRGSLRMEKKNINTMTFVCNVSNVYGWAAKYVKVPSPPRDVNVTKTLSSSVTFSWFYNTTEIVTNFIVERRTTSDSPWATINSLVLSPWFKDNELLPFTTYVYRVRAENVLGKSRPCAGFNVSTREGVPSTPSRCEAKSFSLTSITVYWGPPHEPHGQLTNIMYEVYCKENTALSSSEVKVTLNNTVKRQLTIQRLNSNTLYVIKIRAGRQIDGRVQWGDYKWLRVRTLQRAPTTAPEEIKVVSNGPRRIYVTWKKSPAYVEGYKLEYKEYETTTNTTTVLIKSWNTISYMIKGLAAGKYYEIQLNMFTSGGDGPWSTPAVVHTDQDRLTLPGPIASTSDSLSWKIAAGGSALAIILLLLLLIYIYLMRKSRNSESSDPKRSKKSRKQGGYDFTDNASRVSNESEGSVEGVYNVNIENDIDLSMFDHSQHTVLPPGDSNLYVENPILPAPQDDSDDSYEAVRLATFIARPSPQPTPHLTGRRQQIESHTNPAYQPDEDNADTSGSVQSDGDSMPVYAQVDFQAKERDRRARENNMLEQLSDDILI